MEDVLPVDNTRHPKAWEDVDVIDMDGQMFFTSHDKGMSYIRKQEEIFGDFYEIPAWLTHLAQPDIFRIALPWIFGQFGNLRCAIKLAKVKFNSAAD
jgi:hypothetical protein